MPTRAPSTRSCSEHDSAWVDVDDDVHWLHGGKDFIWVSERDGWRHAYLVSRDGASIKLLTPGNFDVTEPDSPFGAEYIQAIDSTRGFIYYLASPDNATQVYLYRSRLDGTGRPERVTPAGQTRHAPLRHLTRPPVGAPHVLDDRYAARDGSRPPPRATRSSAR